MKNLFLFISIGFSFQLFGQTSNVLPKYGDSIDVLRRVDLSISAGNSIRLTEDKKTRYLNFDMISTSKGSQAYPIRDTSYLKPTPSPSLMSLSQYLDMQDRAITDKGDQQPKNKNKKRHKRN